MRRPNKPIDMNDIKFNCPHCGQSLAVDAASAGQAVACPQCGQTISVPQPAQLGKVASPAQISSRGKGLSLAVLVALALLLLVAGLLFWQMHVRPGGARASVPALPANLTTNLVFYFNFDSKPSGGILPDLSGNGNNGEADNVQWVADGHRGGALVLSPTDSHIRVSNNASLNPPQFTLCAWIKTSYTDGRWRRIFDKGLFHHDFSLSVAGDWTHWYPPTKNRGFIMFEMPRSVGVKSRRPIADGNWHQLVATYDGQDQQLFVDGQLQGKAHCPDVSLGNDLDLVIGGFTDPDPKNDDPHASFDGSLDDVMMFNRAVSPDEVAALYNSQKTASDANSEPGAPLIALSAANAVNGTASSVTQQPLPAEVGLNIHFVQGHEHDLDMIAAAGIKVVRMDFIWSKTETVAGVYDWSAYDELTTNLVQRGLRPYYILDYSNPLYESNSPPVDPAGVAAFARWAGAAAKHYQGRNIIWEIWNEPNGGGFWKNPNPKKYAALALATCKAIRESDPHASIVGPGAFSFPWDYLETVFKSGVLADFDAVSVHPYRHNRPPETVGADYERLSYLISQYAPQGKHIPIISSEWGYATYNSPIRGVSLQTQADFIARRQLFDLLSGVVVSIWYDWKNDGPDPNRIGYNRGLVTVDLQPKPSYRAIQILTSQLSGFRISRQIDTGNDADFVLVLTNAEGTTKLAAWTTNETHSVTMALGHGPSVSKLPWINGNGDSGTLEINGDKFNCELNRTPEYITLGKVRLGN